MTATRLPGRGLGPVDGEVVPVAQLRRDGEPLRLLELPTPVVGERMQLLLAVREDGVPTVRTTTVVREIR